MATSGISSRQNALVKTFREVARGDPSRGLLDGWRLIREAMAAGIDIDTVAVAQKIERESDAMLLAELEMRSGARVVTVTPNVMDAISPVHSPSGAVAIVRRREARFDDLVKPAPALVIVAVDIQDPGNAGAIVRAAEAGGATGVVFAGDSADPWGWKALRAAMGSTFRLPASRHRDLMTACRQLRGHRVSLVASVPSGGASMDVVDLRGPTAVLVGGEGGGLSAAVIALADSSISVPMRPPVESLNVAVASAVLVYEARRQRLQEGSRRRFSP